MKRPTRKSSDAVTQAYLAINLAILRKSNASFNRSLEILRESKIKAFSKIEELGSPSEDAIKVDD